VQVKGESEVRVRIELERSRSVKSPGLGSQGKRRDLRLHRLTLPLISVTNQTRGQATSEILTSDLVASLDKNTESSTIVKTTIIEAYE
jgi:hypothetical protein